MSLLISPVANLIKNNKILKGVRLKTRGNGEIYHIFIRTSENRSYRDFYSATFITNKNWEIVDELGQSTYLEFTKIRKNISIDPKLFIVKQQ